MARSAAIAGTEISLNDRLKTIEAVAAHVSNESELTLHLYKLAMNMAIDEAKSELQGLRSNQFVQQCSVGIDRANTCLMAWKEATRILDGAFARRNVAGTNNEFRNRLSQIAAQADSSGAFAPLPKVDFSDGLINFFIDKHREKKCVDLQEIIIRTLATLGNALIENSSILISTRAVLEPMRSIAERPAAERVDVIWVLVSSLENSQSELNRAMVDSLQDVKPTLYKVLPLRNLRQPPFGF